MDVKHKLYQDGVMIATDFLRANKLALPHFWTYAEAAATDRYNSLVRKLVHQRFVGMQTGFYHDGHVFINVPVTAFPATKPAMRNWSLPGYKVDRTATGVVAHETGHHVQSLLIRAKRWSAEHGDRWRRLIEANKKRVSGYEPVPSEALAETLRLFILNPALLRAGLPDRYNFLLDAGLVPLDRGTWKRVLKNNAPYIAASERWIAQ